MNNQDAKLCIRCEEMIPFSAGTCPMCRASQHGKRYKESRLIKLSEVEDHDIERYHTGPWDVSWGGGIVPDSTTLLGGMPGAGKSTLLLQILEQFEKPIIISAEESPRQIKGRAIRLGINMSSISLFDAMGGMETMDRILEEIGDAQILAVDSLQGMVSGDHAAALTMLRTLKSFAVINNCPVIVLSHATKDDLFAGLLAYQHDVDTTIMLDGQEDSPRVLSARKNRHGPAGIKTRFIMTENGLIPE